MRLNLKKVCVSLTYEKYNHANSLHKGTDDPDLEVSNTLISKNNLNKEILNCGKSKTFGKLGNQSHISSNQEIGEKPNQTSKIGSQMSKGFNNKNVKHLQKWKNKTSHTDEASIYNFNLLMNSEDPILKIHKYISPLLASKGVHLLSPLFYRFDIFNQKRLIWEELKPYKLIKSAFLRKETTTTNGSKELSSNLKFSLKVSIAGLRNYVKFTQFSKVFPDLELFINKDIIIPSVKLKIIQTHNLNIFLQFQNKEKEQYSFDHMETAYGLKRHLQKVYSNQKVELFYDKDHRKEIHSGKLIAEIIFPVIYVKVKAEKIKNIGELEKMDGFNFKAIYIRETVKGFKKKKCKIILKENKVIIEVSKSLKEKVIEFPSNSLEIRKFKEERIPIKNLYRFLNLEKETSAILYIENKSFFSKLEYLIQADL